MSITNTSIRTIKILAGIGLLAVSACSSNVKKENQTNADTAIAVTIATPSSDQQEGLNISGQIESVQSANISTRVMGYITKLNVKVGDHVVKGQLLVTISNDDILAKRAQADAMISEAEVAAKNAQKDYDRFSALYKQQSASAKELDNVTQQNSSAKSRLEQAKQMRNEISATLSYTNLTAPFAGTVTQKVMDAGSMANPGMTILTIEQNGSYQVSASVPESVISQVREGATATININAINKVIKGNITQVNQSSQFSGGQYLIKISIPDAERQGLFAGMYANVFIPVKQTIINKADEDQVMVPITSIEHKDQLTGIYTIGNNNTALLRWVRLGKVEGNQAEVLSGLAPHEQFIVSADGRLFNGAAVKINK
jgi:RND family efflux transporter MFP subunit